MPPKYDSNAQVRAYQKSKEREEVLRLWSEENKSHAAIAEAMGMSKSTVQTIIQRFAGRADLRAKKPPGRPTKITARCDVFCVISLCLSGFSATKGA